MIEKNIFYPYQLQPFFIYSDSSLFMIKRLLTQKKENNAHNTKYVFSI